MPTPPLSEAVLQDALDALEQYGSCRAASDALGIPYNTLNHRIHKARAAGLHLSEGMRQSMRDAKLDGMAIDGGWIITDKDGEIIKRSTRYSAKDGGKETLEETIARVKSALEDMTPAAPIPVPARCDSDLLTLYPITDAHIGMMAWGKETGEDYDTQLAHDRLVTWMGRAVAAAPASKTAIVLDVGDLNHSDDQKNMTPGSGHILDADTRHFKTLEMTIAAVATAVEMAAAKHDRVIVRILPGNHNPTSYMTVLFALAERYRDNPRIEVQKVPGEFFVHQFGKCLIAAHHGDKAKAERLVMFVADSYAEMWGKTVHRFLFTGHRHHSKIEDIGGVLVEQLRAMTAKDAYAVSHAYSARAQLQAVTYHRDLGEIERAKVSGP